MFKNLHPTDFGCVNTICHTQLCHVAGVLCVAGVALGDIHLRFAWQAWHLDTSTCVWRGRRGTWWLLPSFCVAGVALAALGWLWWRAWARLLAGDAVVLCVPGVALGDIHLCFAWHAWHLATSTFASWQAWHLATSTFVLRGRRGTCGIARYTLHYTQHYRNAARGSISGQERKNWLGSGGALGRG